MILIYCPNTTARHEYLFSLLFGELLGTDYELTTDLAQFKNFEGARIQYGGKAQTIGVYMASAGLLDQVGYSKIEYTSCEWEDYRVPFAVDHPDSHLPFDPFSASFYLVSRYEEYVQSDKDKHGRFKAVNSLAYQFGFLQKPVINRWIRSLFHDLLSQDDQLKSNPRAGFYFQASYDIDLPYAYKNRGFKRTIGGSLNSIKRGKPGELVQRLKVLLGQETDPFDNFDFLDNLSEVYGLLPLYFLPMGDFGGFDRNYSHRLESWRKLVTRLSKGNWVGLHPSYASVDDPERIAMEKDRLTEMVKQTIDRSRQHYIRFKLPDTYQHLNSNGIKKEYSMGYPDAIGFRASIASSFPFYDLQKERATDLRVYPFMVMDVSLKHYLGLSAQEALNQSKKLVNEAREVEGLFVSIWHNESLGNKGMWERWRSMYEKLVAYAMEESRQA